MKHYLHINKSNTHYSLQHDFTSVFKKIEFVFLCFLCLVFIATSKLNKDFSRSVSSGFISVSLPVIKVTSLPFNTAINLLTNFQELIEAKKNNEILKAENEKLKSFYINAVNVGYENKELKQALQFIVTKSSNYKAGHIIARTSQVFNQAVYIDIGQNREIKEGAIVSGNRGAIGRISEVFDDKARLLLITDANSRIPVITSKARVRGILAGNNSSTMEILYLQKNHAIKPGDFVFTSGDGDTLPAGILVGMVKKVDKGYAAVEMVENINNADIITVMEY